MLIKYERLQYSRIVRVYIDKYIQVKIKDKYSRIYYIIREYN